MRNIPQYLGATQAQRTRQPCESRVDRAFLYPVRNKRESWQSDFVGVVRLSASGQRYWVNVWAADQYRLRLSEKDGLGLKTPICRLSPAGPGRYTGELRLRDEDSSQQFLLRVWLHETDQRGLSLHFETIARRAQ
jgi:hypothetical protein